MKLNLIIPSFYPATVYGGPIFSTLYTCEALSELDDMEVYVSTTNTNRDSKLDVEANIWIKFNEHFWVKYYDETKIGKFSFSLFINVWRDIKASDIVHIQGIFSTPTPVALFYAFLFRKPVIMSPRGSFCTWCLAQGSKFKKLWMKLIINPFGNHIAWHATSESEKDDILKLFPKSKVYVVPNGIDLDSFSHVNPLEKQEYVNKYIEEVIPVPSKIVVSMGRLHKVKGFDILIKSFVEVLKKYPDAILCIAGKDVGEKEQLETLVQKYELEKFVFFVGEVSDQDKIDFLGNADLFVLPSHTENFGNVYVESLAAGTPIVASTGTPWQEVESAECGKWVENSIEDTSNAILDILLKDRKLMCVNARKLAQKYDWENVSLQFKDVFRKIKNG